MTSDTKVMNVIEGRSNLQELYTRVRKRKSTQRVVETISAPSGVVYQIS